MIIQIMANLFEEGYLDRGKYTLLSPFFSNGNVAFRKEALGSAEPYDRNCRSGEDQDLCFRLARDGWELYFTRDAVVRHKCRNTLRSFVRQWFNYGFHHPYLFMKHLYKGLRIYRTEKDDETGAIYKPLLSIGFPVAIIVFLTSFLAMHVFLALTILFAAIGLDIPAILCGAGTLALALHFFKADILRKNILQGIAFVCFRYLVNLALIAGGLLGGAKRGMLYIGATFDYSE